MTIKLTKEQLKHFESIRWLIQDGPLRVGKTFLMCVIFLEKAMKNNGQNIYIFDHNPASHHSYFSRLTVPTIKAIFETKYDTEKYKLKIDFANRSIKIVLNSKEHDPNK